MEDSKVTKVKRGEFHYRGWFIERRPDSTNPDKWFVGDLGDCVVGRSAHDVTDTLREAKELVDCYLRNETEVGKLTKVKSGEYHYRGWFVERRPDSTSPRKWFVGDLGDWRAVRSAHDVTDTLREAEALVDCYLN